MALPEPLNPVFVGDDLPEALNAERTAINQLAEETGDRVPFPTGAETGDLMRFDGIRWVTTDTRFFEGEGDPNGQIAAPVGSRYVDKLATGGIVEWTKTLGEDNQGWTVAGANLAPRFTGRRNLASKINTPAGSAVNAAFVQRYGNVVDMYLDLTMPTAAMNPWELFTSLPGFAPGYNRWGAFIDNKEQAANGSLVLANGGVNLYATVSKKRDRFSATWITADAWPVGAQLPPAA